MVAVVIVNYNSQDLVIACISSLKEHIAQKLLYLIVDNSEQDDTGRIIEAHADALILRMPGNKGFAAGCNCGIKKSVELHAEYILLLNPDTFAGDDFIAPLVSELERDNTVGMAAPTILLDDERKTPWYAGARMNWWLKGPVHLTGECSAAYAGKGNLVPFASGCAMLIRTEEVHRAGYMDESYFLYFEDADYCQRWIKSGLEIVYVPSATVYHKLSATTGVQSERSVYYISRNRIKFIKKWAKWYHVLIFMVYNTLVKLPGAMIIFGIIRRKPVLMKAYWRGYLHGIGTKSG